MINETVVRQCGLIEHFSTSRHALGFNRGIANACQYVVVRNKLEGRSVQTVMEEAVARLVIRLGGLRVGITGEGTNQACFVQVASMNVQDFISWKTTATKSSDEYDELLLHVIKTRLEQLWPDVAHRPPWQLLVVQNELTASETIVLDIVFAVHHALSDGKSTAVFHSELLRELNSPPCAVPELKDHVLRFSSPPVLAPSQEDLVQPKISWPFFLRVLWSEFGPSWAKPTPPPEPWTGKPITPEPHRLHLHAMTIGPNVAKRLIATCRTHGTTLSGILHILVLASFARHVPEGEASSFSGETPISLLPWAKLPHGLDMDLSRVLTDLNTGTKRVWEAATVANIRSKLDEGDENTEEELIWPLAATWRNEIKTKVANLPNDDVVGMMQYITDFNKRWLNKLGKARDATWELSNIGTIQGRTLDGEELWSIQRSLFTQSLLVAGAAVSLNVAGVDGGPIGVVFSWQETIVEETIVSGVARDLQAWLDNFSRVGEFGIFNKTQ
ncbi:hypothetical protein N0V93_003500 [Gnomoniopsis smithogilvyi]|uniref:Alcohol acetyltransferase n=1 Tax=Gnomoniopsis smithogilvyi TaxID=1191159 RepID=A0A9W8YYP4_9PEZI|nr:hypothetical protein N0V93_003500 [Gnomoniopsis smithogilvyi]